MSNSSPTEPPSPPTDPLLPTLLPPPSGSDTAGEMCLTLTSVPPAKPVAPPESAGRYVLDGEIGRGGMGAVWRAYDSDLKRPLAVKIMLGLHQGRPDLEARFLEEAQITGQLQHPGIPPVHEIGRLGDGRPFFAMKLIEGRTLAELLRRRASPSEDLPRFVAIFGQVCQALAYAHKQGILHRDLKPSNVMVGAFGEVQVMDWGLAKQLTGGGRGLPDAVMAQEAEVPGPPESSDRTQAGSVLGTPAYMAPEQARGETEHIDERTDVFGLGGILCAILTAEPPFRGPDGFSTLAEAARGDLSDAIARLDACGADADLTRLAKWSLAADREKRPRQGQELAEAVEAYQTSVMERLRTAELERARIEVKAAEERKRRRLALALAAAVLAVLLLGGGGAWWLSHQRAARRAEETRQRELMGHDVEAGLRQAEALQLQARWAEAEAALSLAGRRAAEDEAAELAPLVEQARQRLAFVKRLATIRLDKSLLVDGKQNKAAAPPAYAAAFREYGLPVVTADRVVELVRQITASPIKEQLLAALEDWALGEPEEALRRSLWQLTDDVDPQPWRRTPRDEQVWNDKTLLAEEVGKMDLALLSPALLVGLGERLETLGGDGVVVLERGWRRHPDDFWVCFALANLLNSPRRDRRDEAVGYYRAAAALRPDTAAVYHNLGNALFARKDLDGAEAACGRAVKLAPRLAPSIVALGVIRFARGDVDGALARFHEALAIDGGRSSVHLLLWHALGQKEGKQKEARAAYERAVDSLGRDVQLAPNDPAPRRILAHAYFQAGRWADAVKEFRKVVELAPEPHDYLGLGQALYFQGDKKEALDVVGRARELAPKDAAVANFLTTVYRGQGYELYQKGDWNRSINASRQAIILDPADPMANYNLVMALYQGGRFAEAAQACDMALGTIRSEKHLNNDQIRNGITTMREMAEQQLTAERTLLPALLGEVRLDKAPDALELASFCKRYKNRPAAAARFYAEAFALDPRLTAGPPVPRGHVYSAACASSLAASGKGDDAKHLDEKERARLRQQAFGWLRAELTAWGKLADNKEARPRLMQTLATWQKDEELAGVREAQELAKLPEQERADWGKLWGDVAGLLRKTEAPR